MVRAHDIIRTNSERNKLSNNYWSEEPEDEDKEPVYGIDINTENVLFVESQALCGEVLDYIEGFVQPEAAWSVTRDEDGDLHGILTPYQGFAGFGSPATLAYFCEAPAGLIGSGGDCNDASATAVTCQRSDRPRKAVKATRTLVSPTRARMPVNAVGSRHAVSA